MPYASGRVIHDADAHIMEVPGFLEDHLEARHRATVTDLVLFLRHEGFHSTRLKTDPAADFDETQIMLRKNWAALGSSSNQDRPRSIDLLGFASQLMFTTASSSARSTGACCRPATCRWSTSSAPPALPARRSNWAPRR